MLLASFRIQNACVTIGNTLFCMQVVERAEQVWEQDKAKSVLLGRVKFCGGDFFAHGGHL